MSLLQNIAGSLGPAAPVLESVFGSVAGAMGNTVGQPAGNFQTGGAAAPDNTAALEKALQSMQTAFAGLFGRVSPQVSSIPMRPPIYGTGFIQPDVAANPMQSLLPLQTPFQQAGSLLQDLASRYPALQASTVTGNPYAGLSNPPSDGTLDGIITAGDLKFLDDWQTEVEKLMVSQNPTDQIKAQMKMNQLSRIVDMITTLLTKQRDIQSRIAQNMAH